jgi:hypothetical protein
LIVFLIVFMALNSRATSEAPDQQMARATRSSLNNQDDRRDDRLIAIEKSAAPAVPLAEREGAAAARRPSAPARVSVRRTT